MSVCKSNFSMTPLHDATWPYSFLLLLLSKQLENVFALFSQHLSAPLLLELASCSVYLFGFCLGSFLLLFFNYRCPHFSPFTLLCLTHPHFPHSFSPRCLCPRAFYTCSLICSFTSTFPVITVLPNSASLNDQWSRNINFQYNMEVFITSVKFYRSNINYTN